MSQALTQLQWTAPTMVRQGWGAQFRDEMRLLGTPVGAEVMIPCGSEVCAQEKDPNHPEYGSLLLATYNTVRSNVWILWTEHWIYNLDVADRVGLVRAGTVFFACNGAVPTNLPLAQGLLLAMEDVKPTTEYKAWHDAKFGDRICAAPGWTTEPCANATMDMVTGLGYESAYLFAHALHKLSSEGTAMNNGVALMAALKSVKFSGTQAPVHYEVKLNAGGEIAVPYKMFNWQAAGWKVIGDWELIDTKWTLKANWGLAGATAVTNSLPRVKFFRGLTVAPTSIIPPGSGFITVAMLVPSLSHLNAKLMADAAAAANGELGLLNGYSIKPLLATTGMASEANSGKLMAVVGPLLTASNSKLLLGPALNTECALVQPVTAHSRMMMISNGCAQAGYQFKAGMPFVEPTMPLFARTIPSDGNNVAVFIGVLKSVGLTGYFGVLYTYHDIRARSLQQVAAKEGTKVFGGNAIVGNIGLTTLENPPARHAQYAALLETQVRFLLVALSDANWNRLFQHDCGQALIQKVPFWIGMNLDRLGSSYCGNASTWLTAIPSWNMTLSSPVNRLFLKSYRNATGTAFSHLHTGADQAIASYNSVIVAASAMSRLFAEGVFPLNLNYTAKLFEAMAVPIPGAGGPIVLNSAGNLLGVAYSIMARREVAAGARRGIQLSKVGDFVPTTPAQNLTLDLSAIFPGNASVPGNPMDVQCPAGTRQRNAFSCAACEAGSYSAFQSSPKCFACHLGAYAEAPKSAICKQCAAGATTWVVHSVHSTACRCEAGHFASNLESVPRFKSTGCYQGTGMTFAGDLSVLGDCNWACIELAATDGWTHFLVEGHQCFCTTTVKLERMKKLPGAQCSSPCPQDKSEKCGLVKKARRAAQMHTLSAYAIVDIAKLATPCLPCPKTSSAIGHESSANCKGGLLPPVANPGYWARPTFPILNRKFFKCPGGKAACRGGMWFGDHFAPATGTKAIISQCNTGYQSTLCSACSDGYYKSFPLKKCAACPDPVSGWILYVGMPILMIGFWYPALNWVYEMTPSFFITFTYLQMSAIIGMFSFSTGSEVNTALALADTVNFNANLLMTDCSAGQGFLGKWLILQLLPTYYWLQCYIRHVYDKHTKSDDDPTNFRRTDFIATSLRLSNLLYLPVASNTIKLFSCAPLGDGTFYMITDPSVQCWEGAHLAATCISVFQFLTFLLGWPTLMFIIFYVGKNCHLLTDPYFVKLFGWLYKRYEVEYYW